MVRGVLGSFHQGCHRFAPFNGMQCTAMSLIALLAFYSIGNQNISSITETEIDDFLYAGNGLYGEIVESVGEIRYLSHHDLPNTVNFRTEEFSVTYFYDQFYGHIDGYNRNSYGQLAFDEAIVQSHMISPYQLLTIDGLTIALYIDPDDQHFYIFDAHERNAQGLFSEKGQAVLLSFSSLDELLNFFLDHYSDNLYELTPIQITRNHIESVQNEKILANNRSNILSTNHSYSFEKCNSNYRIPKRKKVKLTCELPTIQCLNFDPEPDQNYSVSDLNSSMINVGFVCNISTSNDTLFFDKNKSDHSYYSRKKDSSLKRRKATRNTVDYNIECDELFYSSSQPLNVPMLDVAHTCEVSTTINMEFIDYVVCKEHMQEYEEEIRLKPDFTCSCCLRILYKNQVHVLRNGNDATDFLELELPSDFCSTCLRKLKCNEIPSLSYEGNCLDPGKIPNELLGLSHLEKRLIAKMNIFMSVIMLPGGQYAEKGLILNLPAQTTDIISKLPLDSRNVSHVLVGFEKNTSCPVQLSSSPVCMHTLRRSLQWLKENNPLFADIEICPLESSQIEESNNCDMHSLVPDHIEEDVLIGVNPSGNCIVNQECNDGSTKSIIFNRNTQKPVDIFTLSSGEEMAFPWLFPYGINGYIYDRLVKINPNMYFRSRLYSRDERFRQNITYLLHSAVSYNVSCLKSAVNIRMKVTQSFHRNSEHITVGNIRNFSNNSDLVENSYMFMKKIKGTVAYFKNMLYDLLASFRCLGPPTLFMTLSADDLHWPELGMTLEGLNFSQAYGRSFFTSMRNDPVLTATHFDRRFNALLKFVLLGSDRPLGNVVDYFARVEFQNRGSPHIHMFLWIADMPYIIDNTTAPVFVRYINKTISSVVPDFNEDPELCALVQRLQTHSHSNYCMKNQYQCRFGFPKKCSRNTTILNNIDVRKRNRGRFYITKRNFSSIYVNDYNPVVLRHWRANMDIQVIQNAEGAAYYVCSYLCKAEPDDLKNALGELIHNILNPNPTIPRNVRLMKIGLCVLKHRRMSSQEAVFRMGALHLMHASREFVYVNTWPIEKRMKILKPYHELENLADNDTNVFQYNIIDYYRDRPRSLEEISLFRFASWFVKVPTPKKPCDHHYLCRTFQVWFRKKKKFSVVRYSSFPFGSHDYFYSMILLLYPHRQESSILSDFSTAQQAFDSKKEYFDQGINHLFVSLTEEIENAVRRIRLCENEINEENDEQDSNGIEVPSFPLDNVTDNDTCFSKPSDSPEVLDEDVVPVLHSLQTCSLSISEYNKMKKRMSLCQKKALNTIELYTSKQQTYHVFITGGAGTGKSYLLRIIIAYLQIFNSQQMGCSPVVVCAPTGTAARNIQGTTIHSLLQIPVSSFLEYTSLSNYSLAKMQRKFAGVNTIVIDEISMVSDRMLTYISRRLSEIKNNDSVFGGMNVIAVGDFFQLRPVRGQFAFCNKLLWYLFEPIFLKQNMRQCKDKEYAKLLNRARVGYLQNSDIDVLLSRLNFETNNISNVLRVFPLRQSVAEHNINQLQQLPIQALCIEALHWFDQKDLNPGSSVPSEMIPLDDRDAGGLPLQLQICVDARVMLLRNILTPEGLVNGAMGRVHSISMDTNGRVSSININFDDSSIGQTLKMKTSNAISIERIQHSFIINGRTIIRCQFPLTLCWACTIHKVQGLSLDNVCVDLGSCVFEKGMAYVALSRVKKLTGLFLLKLTPSVIQPPSGVLEEYDRLRHIK